VETVLQTVSIRHTFTHKKPRYQKLHAAIGGPPPPPASPWIRDWLHPAFLSPTNSGRAPKEPTSICSFLATLRYINALNNNNNNYTFKLENKNDDRLLIISPRARSGTGVVWTASHLVVHVLPQSPFHYLSHRNYTPCQRRRHSYIIWHRLVGWLIGVYKIK